MLYESAELELAVAYGIGTLRFARAPAWRPVLFAVNDALATIAGHPAVDVLVVREFHHLPAHAPRDEAFSVADAEALRQVEQGIRRRIAALGIPTVAYLDGPVTAANLAFAHACGWRAASSRASFATDSGTLTAGQARRLHLLDRAWPDAMAEVHLLALELDLQQRPRRPNRRSALRAIFNRRPISQSHPLPQSVQRHAA
jgi:hypothetical protein